ncbi:MAG: hypothetical protein RI885_102 [Actinomycetota bacterium]|jgi:hypothetical protein
MPHTPPRAATRVVVRPRRSLVRRLTLSFAGGTSPVFLALYILSIPRGTGVTVLAGHALVVLVFVLVLTRRTRQMIWVTDAAVVRIGLFGGPRVVPRQSIASLVLTETYRTNAPDTATQLLLQDAAGARLLRLDGVFWDGEAIARLVAALEIPPADDTDPMTAREYFARYPGSAFWFQRRGIPALGVSIGLLAFGALVLGLMWVVGIPLTPPF